MAGQMESLEVNKENMFNACKKGYLNATDVADYLANKGVYFRDAHHISARLVKYASSKALSLDELDLETYKNESDLFEEDIYKKIELKTCVNKRKSLGGPNKTEVLRQINIVKEKIKEYI